MSGAGITIDVALEDIATQAVLKQLQAISGDLTLVMDEIGGHVMQTTQERFDEGHGPAGVPWKPSRNSIFAGGKTMVVSGRMQSVTRAATATDVTVGTNVKYAAQRQFGGVIRAKTAKGLRFGGFGGDGAPGVFVRRSVTQPARPFLGIDAADETEILAIVQRHIGEILGGVIA